MDISLSGIPETLLITVRARAEETIKKDPLLLDTYAIDILSKIDESRTAQNKKKVARSSQIGVVIRTLIFDSIVNKFTAKQPNSAIVALGCGLDARFARLKPDCYCWYDLDLPESIDIRKLFFSEQHNYKMIDCSMLNYSWMNNIPTDKPLLIISEGVFMYFKEEALKSLVKEIFCKFPQAEMVFDVIPPFLAKNSNLHTELKKYDAQFAWGLGKAEDLKKWDEHIEVVNVDYLMDQHLNKWPLSMRLIRLIPMFRKGNMIIHIRHRK